MANSTGGKPPPPPPLSPPPQCWEPRELTKSPIKVSPEDSVCQIPCGHCLQPLPKLDTNTPYCSPTCEAAAWLVYDYVLAPHPAHSLRHGELSSPPERGHLGKPEDQCLSLLAKRTTVCLSHGEGDDMLQPLWNRISSAIHSFSKKDKEGQNDHLMSCLRLHAFPIPTRHDNLEATSPCDHRGLGLFLQTCFVKRSEIPNARLFVCPLDGTVHLVASRAIETSEPISIGVNSLPREK